MGNKTINNGLKAAAVFIALAASLSLKAQNKLDGYEYWFDNEHANNIRTSISPTAESSIAITVNTSELSEGVHALNLRAFDQNGCYSSVLCHLFYKAAPGYEAENNITYCQYWFDDDYAAADISPLAPQKKISLNELVSADDLEEGIHLLSIRFRDSNKAWSSILNWSFYKIPAGTVGDNVITAYRYWLNNDSGSAVYRSLATPGSQVLMMDDIDFSRITEGMYTINIQFRDANGAWSQVITADMTKAPLPLADYTHTEDQRCDTTLLFFSNNSVDADVYNWDFGDGNSDTARNPIHSYTTTGIYKVTLTAKDTITGIVVSKASDINVSVRKVDTGVTQDGFMLTVTAADATFQWLNCNNSYVPVEGATAASFTPSINGSYAARIEQNGCADTTVCYEVTPVGIDNSTLENRIILSPNPTNGKFTVNTGEPLDHAIVKIYDQAGRLIQINEFHNTRLMEITLSDKPGIYFVVINSGSLREVFKLLKE